MRRAIPASLALCLAASGRAIELRQETQFWVFAVLPSP